jgi:protein TonB
LAPDGAAHPAASDDQKSGQKSGTDDDPVTEPVYDIGGDVKPPRVVHRVMPEFTEKSREQHVEGSVVLVTVVTSKGEAHQIRVQKSLDKELDQKAIEALRQWQFQPGQKDNKPVATRVSIEIRFNVL